MLLSSKSLCRGLPQILALLSLLPMTTAAGDTVVINEFMSSNGTTIADEDGDYEDWIELYNFGAAPVDLTGWGLTDDPGSPFRWTFPEVSISPGDFLLVWASGKDRTGQLQEGLVREVWTGIPGAQVEDLTSHPNFPHNPDSRNRVTGLFEAPTNIGDHYGQRLRGLIRAPQTGEYTFWIASDDNSKLFLSSDQNPANEAPIASVPGWTHPREWTKYPEQRSPGIFLQEGQLYSVTALMKEHEGGDHLAVRWRLPDGTFEAPISGQHLFFPGEHLHTGFRISASGEPLQLTRPDGGVADFVAPVDLARDVSFGRYPDGSDEWRIFVSPTPGESNLSTDYVEKLEDPLFSHDAGFFTGAFELQIAHPGEGVQVRYTLDGSEPTETSALFQAALTIQDRSNEPNVFSTIETTLPGGNWREPVYPLFKGTVVRARAFREDALPSRTVTRTFFVSPGMSERYTLPIVSIATDGDNFFSDEYGIYVPGAGYDGVDTHTANFHQRGEEWERPVHIEIFETDGTRVLAQDAGARIHGGASRAWFFKSLRMYARGDYGETRFNYQLFPDQPHDRYNRFILRNSGNDRLSTLFRDAFIQRLIGHMKFDTQAYRPVVQFLNGEYWGIHNARERFDRHYLERTHGVDPENIDLLTNNAVIKEGNAADYHALLNYIRENDIRDAGHFEEISRRMDIENYIDYNVAKIYMNNTDWPHNNVDFWRVRTRDPDAAGPHDGRWRWLLYDTDFGFWLWQNDEGSVEHDTLHWATRTDVPRQWARELLQGLLRNDSFRRAFINRFADQLNSGFQPSRVTELIDAMQAVLRPEMPEHIERYQFPVSIGHWENEVERMRSFGQQRPDRQRAHIVNHFNLSGTAEITIDIRPDRAGTVRINTLEIGPETLGLPDPGQPYPWSGVYFEGIPVELEARPASGYRFAGWEGASENASPLTTVLSGDSTLTAVFEPDEAGLTNLVPPPHDLRHGAYVFSRWDPGAPAGTYPLNMIFEQTAERDAGLDAEMDSYWILPYNLTSRSRINGLGDDGFSFINTSNAQDAEGAGYLGSAILAMTTLDQDLVRVQWTAGTVTPNDRAYALRLQYRLGDEGAFADVLNDEGGPVEYIRNASAGHTQTIGPILLPEEARDRPYVQLRWLYHHLSGDSGPRAQLRIGDILVTSGESGGADRLVFDASFPEWAQSGDELPPFSVRAVDSKGVTDPSFNGTVTVALIGEGNFAGTTTAGAVDGTANFEGIQVEGSGPHRLRASTVALDPADSEWFSLVAITELVMPKFIQGDQDAGGNNFNRIPFAFRLRLDGLNPEATYRYGNRIVTPEDPPDQNGAGNMIFVTGDGSDWIRNTDSPRFRPGDFGVRHHEFTTGADGSFTGWFVTEPSGNARFTPGNKVFVRLLLNNGAGGEEYFHYLTTRNPVSVIRLGSAATEASGIIGAGHTGARNFVAFFDNESGDGRPLATVPVEITGSEIDERYAAFYHQEVATRNGWWGSLVPNDFPGGIRRIEELSLANGGILFQHQAPNGYPGTVNPSSGLSPVEIETVVSGSYSAWLDEMFSDPEHRADPDISGPQADPWGAGIPNLLRYALDIPAAAGADARQRLPALALEEQRLVLTFKPNPKAADVAYIVETGAGPGNWTATLWDSRISAPPPADPDGSIRITDTEAIGESGASRFMRLRVVLMDGL